MTKATKTAGKAIAALLVLSVAVATLAAVFSSAASSQRLHHSVEAHCISGSLVDQATYPRVAGDNNDLVEDCLALLEFRDLAVLFWPRSLQGWSDRTHSTDISDWTGVTVSNGRVTELNLRGHNLENDVEVGISFLGQLTALTALDISNNNLQATIPASIGDIPNLATFAFCNNRLTGAVPVSLRSGVTLTDYPTSQGYDPVRCQQGQTSTSTPDSTTPPSTNTPDPGSEATVNGAEGCFDGTYVSSSAARVSGADNDLAEDCQNLIALKNHWGSPLNSWGSSGTADISSWSGVTVGTITGVSSVNRVTKLNLSSRNLTGAIPAAIGKLTALTDLRLSGNSLTGQIPSQMRNLRNLEVLYLDNNQLSGNLPSWLGSSLGELSLLHLNDNSFTGSIPGSLSSLTELSVLKLSNNRFSGSIPSDLNSLGPAHPSSGAGLTELHICGNDLTGPMPQYLRTTGFNLAGYPRSQGYDPVQCQRGQTITPSPSTTTTTTTTTTIAPSEPGTEAPAQGESFYNLHPSQSAGCITGTLVRPRGVLSPDPRIPGPNNDLVDDCLALLELRENTLLWTGHLRGWRDRTNRTPLSTWTGVTISNGRVTALNLRGHNLQDDSDFGLGPLGKLTALTILDISDNQLTSSIPASIGNLPNLRTFAFCDNRLSGAVPASLRSGVQLVNYPANLGYNPVGCQREQSGTPTPGPTTTTATTEPDSPTTTTAAAPTSSTTTTTTPPRMSVCDPDEREWPALSVGEGGASIAAIRGALFDGSTTQAIYRWYASRGEWARVLSKTGQFPEGRVISLRCVTTDAGTLNRLNLLGGTRQIALRENTNLIVAPEDLTRSEDDRSSYLIAEELTRCGGVALGSVLGNRPTVRGSDSGITVITIRNPDTGRWAISFPCDPVLEDVFIARPENNYDEVSSINQGDIIYLRFITSFRYPDNFNIYWNSETSQYEAGTGPVADTG